LSIEAVGKHLGSARHVLVLTGAGVSAESGVPTFRDARSGLWARYDPLQLATPEAFAADPEKVWAWYRHRRRLVREVEPNPAHFAIAAIEARVPRLTLVTQNVDGLHARAGSGNVLEFHGNLFRNRCFAENVEVAVDDRHELPLCPNCGGPVRPGVVWFGERIPERVLDTSFAAANDCDLMLAIGTSSEVYPAAGLIETARDSGATVAEINPDPTGLSSSLDYAIAAPAGEALPQLLGCLDGRPD
jgi:NAD-dependent deacetylase